MKKSILRYLLLAARQLRNRGGALARVYGARLLAQIKGRDYIARETAQYRNYVDALPQVLQYRQAYFEAMGKTVSHPGLPAARAWPEGDKGLSYEEKLVGMLPLSAGKGAEIGPLNLPITSKSKGNVLYVDHLDTEGLRKKYPAVQGIVPIDRPMVNNSLKDTLQKDAPLDYLVASQVLEHVPDPIGWLQQIASLLRNGGLLALSLPDRRMTFDFMREETRAADIVAAYLEKATTPNVRSVYDNHSLAAYINMLENPASLFPQEIIAGRGAVKPTLAAEDHLALVQRARAGEYQDVHAWVFTPPSFLLVMAQLAGDGFVPFRLRQFYPTDLTASDRCNSSFTVILEKVASDAPSSELRRSYVMPLGE